ncbi:hypothetical protein ACFWZ2_08260 [Streptomyces sp. NPDC059002]|uniref:hypothetical protein n=1 Tax=Streptomyces sp. NPDC059002 TaxID=3346690 RepID=UPI003684C76B
MGSLPLAPSLPVLWLCGPPGVGKTAVGWEMFSQLAGGGRDIAYVDIDQLGICYPEPASDPGRHRMKARNLAAAVARFREAGARCVVVSGVVDSERGVPGGQLPGAVLTVCRLRADRGELRERFLGRGGPGEVVDAVLREADVLDARAFADVCVDTSGLKVDGVVCLVRERTGGWPDAAAVVDPHRPSGPAQRGGRAVDADGGQVLWLCGATGVGKSAVGFEVFQQVLRAGRTAAYVDLDQLGFCSPAADDGPRLHRMKAENLAALWHAYRAAGAERLIVTGPVENDAAVGAYTAALPTATVTLCRLHAGREQLTRRIMARGRGGSWPQPGDPLRGQPTARLLQAADAAVAQADALQRAAIGDLCVTTDDRTAEEVAAAVIDQVPSAALAGVRQRTRANSVPVASRTARAAYP